MLKTDCGGRTAEGLGSCLPHIHTLTFSVGALSVGDGYNHTWYHFKMLFHDLIIQILPITRS